MTAVTSRTVFELGRAIGSGRHALVQRSDDDIVLVRGIPTTLVDAIHQVAASTFDNVVHVTAAGPVTVLTGTLAAETEDPVETAVRQLESDESTLVILEQADRLVPAVPATPQDRWRTALLHDALRARQLTERRNLMIMIAAAPSQVALDLQSFAMRVEWVAPSRQERLALLRHLEPDAFSEMLDEVATETDDHALADIVALRRFLVRVGRDPSAETQWLEIARAGDRIDHWSHLKSRIPEVRQLLERRVVGQPAAIEAAISALSSRATGLSFTGKNRREGQPDILFFTGPTGVGKTELAKAIAEALFGDRESYIRIDMSAFSQPHAAERLVGAPPGYVGHEAGGELTNAVARRPNSVIVLDEIEKAHPDALTRLLSVLDDGRITDAQGRVVHFSEAVIVFTSNIGASELRQLGVERSTREIALTATRAVEQFCLDIGRPELFGRLQHAVVPFDVLRADVAAAIGLAIVRKVVLRNGPDLEIDEESVARFVGEVFAQPEARRYGGRAIRNRLQSDFRRLAVELATTELGDEPVVAVRYEGDQLCATSVEGAAG